LESVCTVKRTVGSNPTLSARLNDRGRTSTRYVTPLMTMSQPQQRQKLLSKLTDAKPLDDPTAFVLIWTYFEEVGLTDVENDFILRRFDPILVDPIPFTANDRMYDPERTRAALAKKRHESDFDRTAVAWLKGLDRLLTTQRGTFEGQAIEGFDGRQYRIRPLNNRIARYFAGEEREAGETDEPGESDDAGREIVGNRKRSLSLGAYCRNFRVIPTEIKGIRIDATSRWANAAIHDRLRSAADSDLCFLAWPLRYALKVTRWETRDQGEQTVGKFIRVSVAADRKSRHKELEQAVEAARLNRAAILVLPELSTASADIPALQGILAGHGPEDFPILTVAGIEHQRLEEHEVNEALVLGPDGEILHRHPKLTRYPADEGFKEAIVTGTSIHVLESPIGNVTPLICLDLFNESTEQVIAASHGNVLLVPSLSERTSAHLTAAYRYLNINLATTVVCNRWFPPAEGTADPGRIHTFTLLPGKSREGRTLLLRLSGDEDYLLVHVE
jgi:hypothetical protein